MSDLSTIRKSIAKATDAAAIFIPIATLGIFVFCYFGYFSNPDVDIADHLQDILETILAWLLIVCVVTLVACFLGTAKTMFLKAFAVGWSALALGFLFFINGMRRN